MAPLLGARDIGQLWWGFVQHGAHLEEVGLKGEEIGVHGARLGYCSCEWAGAPEGGEGTGRGRPPQSGAELTTGRRHHHPPGRAQSVPHTAQRHATCRDRGSVEKWMGPLEAVVVVGEGGSQTKEGPYDTGGGSPSQPVPQFLICRMGHNDRFTS